MSESFDPHLLMGRILLDEELITEEGLVEVLLTQIGHRALKWPGKPLGHHLVLEGLVDQKTLDLLLGRRRAAFLAPDETALGEIAVKNGLVTREEVSECLAEQRRLREADGDERIGRIFLKKHLLGEHQLQAIIDRQRALAESESDEQAVA